MAAENLYERMKEYTTSGFCCIEDFKCSPLTDKDYDSLMKLRDCAKKIENKTNFLEKLSKANSPYEIEKLYSRYTSEIREFAKEQGKLESEIDLVKLPNDALFDNLEENIKIRWFTDFICNDGGEIRGPTPVYGSDGKVIMMRVYWK
jgi:hypothetical protein